MSLANKYRPQTFDEMIGQEHIIDILKAQMQSRDVVHHNYLLFGPRGTGKTTSARLIAKALNCLDLQNGNPCNHCVNCELINNETSLDYVEIDAASHTGVDDIRDEIIDKSIYPPTALRKKIYVIDEVHMLSKSAFNALLKTIEEPKGNVCFILATTEIHKVPDTIISRCQVFNYRKVLDGAMISHLEHICKNENLSYTESALRIIAEISEGCVRDAVKYVDQVSILGDLNEENVSRFLGVAGEALIENLLNLIRQGDRNTIFSKLDDIEQHGIDLSQFAKQTLGYIDKHMLEDVDFYLKCSECFGTIISTLKWYPYPVIAFKIAINNLISVDNQKIDNQPIPKYENNGHDMKVSSPSVSSEKGKKFVDSDSSSESKQEEKHVKKEQLTVPSVSGSFDFPAIWSRVLVGMNKPTAQENLKDQAIIEKKEGSVVEITVITPLAKMLLNNEENKKVVEQLLSKEFGEAVSITTTFVKKEEYFAKKMGL